MEFLRTVHLKGMRWVLVIGWLLWSGSSLGQATWYGMVLTPDSIPVAGASIRSLEGRTLTVSDADGRFGLKVQIGVISKFVVSHIGFLDQPVNVYPKGRIGAVEHFQDVVLRPNVITPGIAEVTGSIDTVFADPNTHVADFVFLPAGGALLLTYGREKRLKRQEYAEQTLYDGCRLVRLGAVDEVLATVAVTEVCLSLYQDFLGQVFLRTMEGDFFVPCEDGALRLERVEDNFLSEWVEPVIDTLGDWVCHTTWNADFPAFEYQAVHRKDSSLKVVHHVVDGPLMEQFRSEYKFLTPRQKLEAFRAEVHFGIEKEIAGAYISGFPRSIYFDELYAPMLVVSDTALVFDHYANTLYRYDLHLTRTDSIPIAYHHAFKRQKFEKELLLDEQEGTVYARYRVAGQPVLRRISTQTGQVTLECTLEHRHADRIRIRDGWAWYTYRPHASAQTRYLYKVPIRNTGVPR